MQVSAPVEAAPVTPTVRASMLAALPGWIVARLLVLAALLVVGRSADGLPTTGVISGARGMEVWDAAWYRALAEDGYAVHGTGAVRFFPLLPALARGVAGGLRLPVWAVLVAISWLCALLFAALLHRLVLDETGDEVTARRSAWLIQLVPGANVLVLGYTEALAGMLAVGFFLALRGGHRPLLAVPAGLLSGLLRPTGLLLAVPAAVELLQRWRAAPPRRLVLTAAALSAPLGTAAYLGWSWWRWGDPLLPYRVQAGADLRGGIVDVQWRYLTHTSPGGYPWPLVLALLAIAAAGLWLCARRLPLSYTAWTASGLLVSATAFGFHSLPRYVASLFPLVIVAAMTFRRAITWNCALAVSAGLFTWVAYLNFTERVVP
jgi:hypothetical protein